MEDDSGPAIDLEIDTNVGIASGPSTALHPETMTPTSARPVDEGTPPPPESRDQTPPREAAVAVPAKRKEEPTIEELAAKKRKLAQNAEEQRKRGQRMFGLLQGTLKRAKQETAALPSKRAEIDARLHQKLAEQRDSGEAKAKLEREAREAKNAVLRKEDEIALAESIIRARHSAKRSLSSFLCTSVPASAPPPAALLPTPTCPPLYPALPHVTRVAAQHGQQQQQQQPYKPLYYLPYKLLRSQSEQVRKQQDAVDDAIEEEKRTFRRWKDDRIDELRDLKARREKGMDEAERQRREERQKKRREQEAKEDDVAMKDASTSRATETSRGDDRPPIPEREDLPTRPKDDMEVEGSNEVGFVAAASPPPAPVPEEDAGMTNGEAAPTAPEAEPVVAESIAEAEKKVEDEKPEAAQDEVKLDDKGPEATEAKQEDQKMEDVAEPTTEAAEDA